ncbi:MAG: HAD-IA family hydrolase [Candidatus Bathyarchaeia archaeon]
MQWLKSQNKHVGVICNTGLTPGFGLRRFLEKEGVAKYFDVMIFSEEVGVRKPDPRIFHLVSEKLKVKPCEVVHLGDNLSSDVWGAKNAGFKAIHFLCEVGRDRMAESDPTSLVSLSRKLDSLKEEDIVPNATISSLTMLKKVIAKLDNTV